MLVHRGVEGDSRVQKQAAAAAAAGWEVFLLGRSPNGKPQEWRIGDATVRLLPVAARSGRRPHELRAAWMRDPLAYSSDPLKDSRAQRLRDWRAEIGFRKDCLTAAAERRPLSAGLGRAAMLPRRAAVRFAGAWIALRTRHTESTRRKRLEMTAPLDRFTTRFWSLAMGERAWRRLDPSLWDLEFGFGPVVDKLAPDLVHANNFMMLGVAARAKMRARARGRDVKIVWDAQEYLAGMKPWNGHPRWHPAVLAYEREFVPFADAAIAVSERHADLMMRWHGLRERPTVVMNTPELRGADEPVTDLRGHCGIGPDVPLMVYSGAAAPQRGLDVMVDALPMLDEVHAVFVTSRPDGPYVRGLLATAQRLGVADRVHLAPYVPHEQVVRYLAGADIGVIPILHHLNHEISLITKFFEYSQARLPLVVSDVETMARTVRVTGQGEVFAAEDPVDFARAVKSVLAHPDGYRRAYDDRDRMARWTWEAQAEILCGVYARLLGGR